MGKKRINICPVTNQPIIDRTYNKRARYSKEGIKIHRREYLREYKKMYNVVGKIVGVGIVTGEQNADRNIDELGQRTI